MSPIPLSESLKNICRLRDKEANVRTTLLPLDGV